MRCRTFYDDHPYPPPVAGLDRYREAWSDPDRLRVEYHLMWPRTAYRQDLEILVAGCGTSQAAKHALRQPAARVTGIDVSATSLRHTRELKRRYGLKNLEVRQLPIERAHELGCRFDKVVCTGVLHHLADPDTGLRALRSVLKPDGAMYLMVYATYGRTGIYMLQEYCRRLQVGTSQREIEDLIAVLRTLPDGHPLAHVLREAPDMQHPDALADALLHPRDRAYTVPQLFDFVERNGCRFGRWYRQAQYLPQCGALSATPHAARLLQLLHGSSTLQSNCTGAQSPGTVSSSIVTIIQAKARQSESATATAGKPMCPSANPGRSALKRTCLRAHLGCSSIRRTLIPI